MAVIGMDEGTVRLVLAIALLDLLILIGDALHNVLGGFASLLR